MRRRKPLTDKEGEVRELLLEDLKGFRPIAEVLPQSSIEKLGLRAGKQRIAQHKEKITLELSKDVLQRFRAGGADWEGRLDAALREWLEAHPTR
jgi:uncharacterized protein (DUF4415 family)